MNKISNILWGIVLIIIGVIFGLNALEITDINIFFDGWWTLFIIIPSFIDLFKRGEKTGSIISLVIGIALLLACRGLLNIGLLFKLIVPIILVIVGLSLVFKDTFNYKVKEAVKKLNENKSEEYCSTFSSQTLDFSNTEFKGTTLTAVFGGIKCNLKDAILEEDSVINVSAIFGGVTIYTSNDINVKIVSNSIFGGVSDERRKKNKGSEKTLYVNATCIFGGVEIK